MLNSNRSPFTIVSGLPRSGTSLMMQMLDAGGLEPLTDNLRTADVSNPKGYYEWEPVKSLARDPSVINPENLNGKCIKVVTPLLPHLPARYDYKIVMMRRNIEEVMLSQRVMLDMHAEQDEDSLALSFAAQSKKIDDWLKSKDNMEVLYVDHHALIKRPDIEVERLFKFIGRENLPQFDKMAAVCEPALYRNRSTKPMPWIARLFKTKPSA